MKPNICVCIALISVLATLYAVCWSDTGLLAVSFVELIYYRYSDGDTFSRLCSLLIEVLSMCSIMYIVWHGFCKEGLCRGILQICSIPIDIKSRHILNRSCKIHQQYFSTWLCAEPYDSIGGGLFVIQQQGPSADWGSLRKGFLSLTNLNRLLNWSLSNNFSRITQHLQASSLKLLCLNAGLRGSCAWHCYALTGHVSLCISSSKYKVIL